MGDMFENNQDMEHGNRNTMLKDGFLRRHSILFVRFSSLLDAAIIIAMLVVTLWYYGTQLEVKHLNTGLFGALIFLIIANFSALYRSWRVSRMRFEILKILAIWVVSLIVLSFVLFTLGYKNVITNTEFLFWFLSAFFLMSLVRYFARMVTRYTRAFGYDVRQIAIVGANETAMRMVGIFDDHPWMGMNVIGVFDSRQSDEEGRVSFSKPSLSGSVDDLIEIAKQRGVDIVYICLPLAAEKRIKKYVDIFSDTMVTIYYCPNFFSFDLIQSRWDVVFGQPVISLIDSPFVDHHRHLKSFEDVVLLFCLLPLVLPLMVLIAVMVKLTSKGPVFFKQDRYGVNGKSFKIWKFRTMYVENCTEGYYQVMKGDSRITPIGRFLRKTSLDEIPQFVNVLLGDMSVVGPRPHPATLNEDLRQRIHRYMLRHKVKPGITGLAQISGLRGETESMDKMERRIEMDLQYIRHWSLSLDIKILFKTFFNLYGSGVY